MKDKIFICLGVAACLTIGACTKKGPIATNTPPNVTRTPVDERTATPPPAQPRAQVTAPTKQTPAPKQVANTAGRQLTPAERVRLEELLKRLDDALFDYDQAAIRPDAMTALRSDVAVIRDILSNYPSQKLLIEGHADERGSAEYNMALGDKRATSAEDLLSNMGIPKSQLTIISYGKDRPTCTDQNENCWQRNRRVHITAP